MLILPSGSYLKENENVHRSITVRRANSKQYCAFCSADISLPEHINTTDTSHVEAPSELLVTALFKFIMHEIEGFRSRLRKQDAKNPGHSRDRNLVTSLLVQEVLQELHEGI